MWATVNVNYHAGVLQECHVPYPMVCHHLYWQERQGHHESLNLLPLLDIPRSRHNEEVCCHVHLWSSRQLGCEEAIVKKNIAMNEKLLQTVSHPLIWVGKKKLLLSNKWSL